MCEFRKRKAVNILYGKDSKRKNEKEGKELPSQQQLRTREVQGT